MDWGTKVTYLASTALRERTTPFGIKDDDRTKHLCVLGRVGSGRAALLARMALQDIERGIGAVVLDTAGNLGPLIMERLTPEARKRLIYLDASNGEYPFCWNIANEFRESEFGAELFRAALPSVYGVAQSALTDAAAKKILETDATVLALGEWVDEATRPEDLAALIDAHKDDVTKIAEAGRYLAKDTMVRNLLGQKEGKFKLTELAEGAIVIVDLSRIRIFPTRVTPLIKFFMYGARVAARRTGAPVGLYFHDCLRYFSDTDVESLFNDRAVALTLSDTIYREDDAPLRNKSLTRCGSVITFQPHPSDLDLVGKSFYPFVSPEELTGLEEGESCVALTIDGVRSKPFFANTLPLPERTNTSLQDMYVEARQKYTLPRAKVDEFVRPPKKDDDKMIGPDKRKGPPDAMFGDAFKKLFDKKNAEAAAKAAGTPPTGTPPTIDIPPPAPKAAEDKPKSEVSASILEQLLYVPLPA